MKKECEALVLMVEKKKSEMLRHVSVEYSNKLKSLTDEIKVCDEKLQQGEGLVEYTQEALKETNAISFLKVRTRERSLPIGGGVGKFGERATIFSPI